jgi:hypothetical protein
MIVLKRSIVSFARKWARLLIPAALSLQYCNLSVVNDLSAAILQSRAAHMHCILEDRLIKIFHYPMMHKISLKFECYLLNDATFVHHVSAQRYEFDLVILKNEV